MSMEGDAAPSMSERPLVLAGDRGLLLLAAWISIITVSDVPNWMFDTFTGQIPPWIAWGKAICLLAFLAACLLWNRLRALLPFGMVILAFQAVLAVTVQVGRSPWWKNLWASDEPSFPLINIQPFLPDMVVTLVVIVALWIVHGSRRSFFLAQGDMRAPIEPVRWLGIGKGESWKVFGWIFAAAATLAVAIPTFIALRPGADTWLKVPAFLPAILLLAAINAFDEEVYYRMTLLSTLPQLFGKRQALLLNAFLFGMAHYYEGSPAGIAGVLMTGFLGWLLGKAMYETKGLAWPWIMHFLPDVVIFTSYAVVWLQKS
jgi:membrane protease YdiL (CAAX protease family)